MILGMSVEAFTTFHVILSLIGIVTGLVVLFGMWRALPLRGMTAIFLATTIATSVTGFMFPSTKIGPPHIVGAISLVVAGHRVAVFRARRLTRSKERAGRRGD